MPPLSVDPGQNRRPSPPTPRRARVTHRRRADLSTASWFSPWAVGSSPRWRPLGSPQRVHVLENHGRSFGGGTMVGMPDERAQSEMGRVRGLPPPDLLLRLMMAEWCVYGRSARSVA